MGRPMSAPGEATVAFRRRACLGRAPTRSSAWHGRANTTGGGPRGNPGESWMRREQTDRTRRYPRRASVWGSLSEARSRRGRQSAVIADSMTMRPRLVVEQERPEPAGGGLVLARHDALGLDARHGGLAMAKATRRKREDFRTMDDMDRDGTGSLSRPLSGAGRQRLHPVGGFDRAGHPDGSQHSGCGRRSARPPQVGDPVVRIDVAPSAEPTPASPPHETLTRGAFWLHGGWSGSVSPARMSRGEWASAGCRSPRRGAPGEVLALVPTPGGARTHRRHDAIATCSRTVGREQTMHRRLRRVSLICLRHLARAALSSPDESAWSVKPCHPLDHRPRRRGRWDTVKVLADDRSRAASIAAASSGRSGEAANRSPPAQLATQTSSPVVTSTTGWPGPGQRRRDRRQRGRLVHRLCARVPLPDAQRHRGLQRRVPDPPVRGAPVLHPCRPGRRPGAHGSGPPGEAIDLTRDLCVLDGVIVPRQ